MLCVADLNKIKKRKMKLIKKSDNLLLEYLFKRYLYLLFPRSEGSRLAPVSPTLFKNTEGFVTRFTFA